MRWAVLLAGGSGSRFWPLSTPDHPKQLLPLTGPASSAEEAVERLSGLIPRDRILVETDAPYLTPMPYRGRPNASYLVPLTMRSMAETRDDDLEELCRAVDANTERAFGGTWG